MHPKLLALLKFRDFDETLFRCRACGKTMTRSDLQGKQPWQRGTRVFLIIDPERARSMLWAR
jgi:DNA polymerase II large subunit